ncbi:MAG: ATP-binding cassette domain-containing protein [Polyangiaceae bacterium]
MAHDDDTRTLRVRLRLERVVRSGCAPGFALDVAFDAPRGVTVLCGASGSGKSTTLAAIAGLLRPTAGYIALGGETWFHAEEKVDLPPHKRGVAVVFQSPALFPHMTATQNVAYGMPREAKRTGHAETLLERLRVAHLSNRKPPTFSGGEAQRVAIARALAMNPRVVLLDEPFSALDPELRRDLVIDVREIVRELHVPVVLVTHHHDEAIELGQRLVVLNQGRVRSIRTLDPLSAAADDAFS